jgi:hypothetical protein
MFKKILTATAFFALLFSLSTPTIKAATGAIFTTESTCSGVNENIFTSKDDVYLDGGPHHEGSAGLEDGNYYVMVTSPSGADVLGKSTTADVTVTDGSFADCYQLNTIVNSFSSGFTTPGYDDTTNGGGVYKVWVSMDAGFANSTNKTDNFKVKANPQESGSITGLKWEDQDGNGDKDPGEPKLSDWTIELWNADHTLMLSSTTTEQSGFYDFDNLTPGTYQVCEVLQTDWHPTFPTTSDPNCHTEVVVEGKKTTKDINFGNFNNAKIIVIKHVINDNGGEAVAADFTMNVTGTNVSNSSFSGEEDPGTTITLSPGAYSVDEGSHDGYVKTLSADCSGTVISGETKTCTITNDDIAPSLTLIKHVTNNNGGGAVAGDWTLTADGPTTISGTGGAVSDGTFSAGTYTLSESGGPDGYDASEWSCTGDVTNTGDSLTIGLGQSATCEITNDDQAAHLIVIKIVDNSTPGEFVHSVPSDFTMTINDVTAEGGNSFPGNSAGVDKTLTTVGSYSVTESGPGGYDASFSPDCAGTIALGETKTCTITNTAITGRMTGGGSVFSATATRITHGFILHCNITALPNNLEINWNDKSGKAHKFHLTSLTSVTCDKTGNPAPPPNTADGFNRMTATGIGIEDGKAPALISFVFTDFGEPGKKDTASYTITGPFPLFATGFLNQGNHQAHLF